MKESSPKKRATKNPGTGARAKSDKSLTFLGINLNLKALTLSVVRELRGRGPNGTNKKSTLHTEMITKGDRIPLIGIGNTRTEITRIKTTNKGTTKTDTTSREITRTRTSKIKIIKIGRGIGTIRTKIETTKIVLRSTEKMIRKNTEKNQKKEETVKEIILEIEPISTETENTKGQDQKIEIDRSKRIDPITETSLNKEIVLNKETNINTEKETIGRRTNIENGLEIRI